MQASDPSPGRTVSLKLAVFACALTLVLGAGGGFLAGALSVPAAREFFVDALEDERSADVARPQRFERPRFRFQYPGNWKVDRADPDFDPDHLVTVESPGASFFMVLVAEGDLAPADATQAQEQAFSTKLFRAGATRAALHRWGRFEGEGVELTGKQLGLQEGKVRLFSWRAGGATFTVVEQFFAEDRAKVVPGLELVRRTFEVPDVAGDAGT